MAGSENNQSRPALVWAMVLQYAVGGAVLPFLTLWLRDRGLGLAAVSWVLMTGAVAMLFSPFLWGMLADRWIALDRLFVVMNGLGAVCLMMLSVQATLPGVLLCFTLFYACYQPTPILVNAIALRHLANPYRDFARLRAWGSLGWILPSVPVVVWLVAGRTRDLGFTLWLGAGFSVAMVLAAFWLPRTVPGAVGRQAGTVRYGQGLRRLLANRDFRVLLLSYFLVSASFAIQSFYSPPRLEDLGMSRPMIGLAQTAGVVWEIVLFARRDAVARWLGSTGTVVAGCAALVVRQVLFAWVENVGVLAASYLLVGTTVVLYHIGVNLMVERLAASGVKSTAQSLLTLCSSGLGPIFANGVVVVLMAGGGAGLPTLFVVSAMFAATAMLLLAGRGGGRTCPGTHRENGHDLHGIRARLGDRES